MTCYVGLDVSMEETTFCVRGPEGRILGQGKVATDPEAIAGALARFGHPERVVLETGRMANCFAWCCRHARPLPKRRAGGPFRRRHRPATPTRRAAAAATKYWFRFRQHRCSGRIRRQEPATACVRSWSR